MKSFVQFLMENKVWWITPLVIVLGLVVVLVVFGDPDPADPEAASPFTYDVH